MPHRRQFVPQFATALLAFGLIARLLPGLAAAQDGSDKPSLTGKGLPDMPMKVSPENSLAYEVSQKPAIASKQLSDMESLEDWEPWVGPSAFGSISLSHDRYHQGQASVLLTSPTKGEEPNFPSTRGRPWGSASAVYNVDNEDWTEWNRITLWVYPDLPGFRTVSFNLVLHNNNPIDPSVDNKQYDDAFVPYDSAHGYHYYNIYSGMNYQLLENQKWNKVYWEIPHVRRDKVIALELRYRLQGNQREMTDTVKYYFDELYLEKVTHHTSGAVHALLSLAEQFQDTDTELSERLLEEAKWGLDWVLKTRFGDGYRVNWGVMDFWTDGILGTVDDVIATPSKTETPLHNYVTVNLHAARAEAKAAILLANKDPIMADYALRCAEEDWNFAVESIQDLDMVTAGIGLNASLTLYEATKDDKYRSAAISYGSYILQCQQRGDLSDSVPLKGFFFENARRERIPLPRSISSPEKYAVTGLVGLLQAFPDSEDAEEWRSAIRLYAGYHQAMAAYTNPYFMLPAGLCDLNVAEDEIEEAKIRNGIQLDDRFYIKCFPVWTTGRGNTSVILSKAIGLAAIARYLEDRDVLNLAYLQFDWLLGLNPFNQSIMWGEGYRYQTLYTPLSGNIVGAVPCGVHTKFNRDLPYWPSDNWHNPKEIWVHSSSDWLWLMTNFFD